ncbi:hypothetical protein GW17_00051603 [Ensete ventricosum]|nr:hypothetical protein GW17_00051603 [Ensete ventricosum]
MSSVVVSYAMVKESAQLNSALVRKLVRKLRRGRLGPLESAPQVLLSCGLSKDPAQKPRQGGELDIAPSILKSVPRLRRDLNPEDKALTYIDKPDSFTDVIYHTHKFYTISYLGTVWEPHGISFKPKVILADLGGKELLGYTTYVLGNPMGFPSSLRLSLSTWEAKSYSVTPRTYWKPHGISFKPKVIPVDLGGKELLSYTTYVIGVVVGR